MVEVSPEGFSSLAVWKTVQFVRAQKGFQDYLKHFFTFRVIRITFRIRNNKFSFRKKFFNLLFVLSDYFPFCFESVR